MAGCSEQPGTQQASDASAEPAARQQLSWPRKALLWLGGTLLALAVLAVTVLFAASGVRPTGDPLYDSYATEVAKRIATFKYSLASWQQLFHNSTGYAATIPDEILAEWVGDFGDDPRYWELRYFCADTTHLIAPQAQAVGIKQPADFLRHSIEQGTANYNTYLLWYACERVRLDQVLNALPYYGSLAEYSATERAHCIEVNTQAEAEELALLDAVIATDPQQAWGFYERAMYWFKLGEQEQGLADLRAGNAAPEADYPLPFPINYVFSEMDAGRAPGSRAVAGAVAESSFAWPLPNFIKIKDALKETIIACELGQDVAPAFNAWQGYASRLGQESYTMLHAMVGIVLVGIMDSWLLEDHGNELRPDQRYALEQHRAARLTVRDLAKAHNRFDFDTDLKRSTFFNPVRGKFHATWRYLRREHQLVVDRFGPTFDDIGLLDYANLELPPELADYQLSAEQIEKDAKREREILEQAARDRAWVEQYNVEQAAREAEQAAREAEQAEESGPD